MRFLKTLIYKYFVFLKCAQFLSALFIILVGLMITSYSEKMPISNRCITWCPTWSENLGLYLSFLIIIDERTLSLARSNNYICSKKASLHIENCFYKTQILTTFHYNQYPYFSQNFRCGIVTLLGRNKLPLKSELPNLPFLNLMKLMQDCE